MPHGMEWKFRQVRPSVLSERAFCLNGTCIAAVHIHVGSKREAGIVWTEICGLNAPPPPLISALDGRDEIH